MIGAPDGAADERSARRRHPSARPWHPDWARLAAALDARPADDGDDTEA